MERSDSILVGFLGDQPFTRVVDFLLENMDFDYSKTEIAKGAEIGWTTLYKVWGRLVEFDLVTPTRRYGKTQLYKINKESPVVKKLLALEIELIEQYNPAHKAQAA